ncbi:hypothetical protein SeMB42_g05272 [Synchytrium endobioticum]|uniref:Translation initiation factor IF2/IF5 domain-containing protein n=1 Tax=Synchytrium endobioticum TaxID=286115 RepID=A0A507CRX7_9FUNG|nr:hypothetical protein SeLEV6574_g05908 [Synchytrium endobioticum]TPX42124.1 hypothetical protein SeMB42_g05272 [Synchytrium endobioticum]
MDDTVPLKKKSKKKPVVAADEAPPDNGAAETGEAPLDDFTGLKKKKKKKLDEPADGDAVSPAPTDDFDFGKKKKKKRPDIKEFDKAQAQDASSGNVYAEAMEAGKADAAPGAEGDGGDDVRADDVRETADEGITIGGAEDEPSVLKDVGETWLGTERDYTYQELLSRVFRIIRQNNPELAGEKKRYTIAPPQVAREGTKKTVFANVGDIARRMRRTPDHLIQYLFAELGTSGSVDGQERLVIRGKFVQKQIETVLKRYIVEYVTCRNCKSADTSLSKDNRLFFLNCQSCGSTRSVSAIKTGFVAQTTKRAAARAAAQPYARRVPIVVPWIISCCVFISCL